MAKLKFRDDLDHLKQDASKVIADISTLSQRVREAGTETSKEIYGGLSEKLEKDIELLKEKYQEIEDRFLTQAKMVDKHVRANPYLYALGSLALGIFAGKFLAPKGGSAK